MLRKNDIFRDAKVWYSSNEKPAVSQELIRFCRRFAGNRILDIGCATGDYCIELAKLGYECTGADVNEAYVSIACEKGVNAVVSGERLPFDDSSYETVIIFEVLEHVHHPELLLQEAKRVSSRNILVTVPDCGSRTALSRCKLTCEHFLELDHINFFTEADLKALLGAHFTKFAVERREPIRTWEAGLPWWLSVPISIVYRLRMFRPNLFNRLYAVAEIH